MPQGRGVSSPGYGTRAPWDVLRPQPLLPAARALPGLTCLKTPKNEPRLYSYMLLMADRPDMVK